MIKLVVGLGNPGPEYEQTRHNIGQMVFDHVSFSHELHWQKKFKGLYASRDFSQQKVHFLKPLTYMNLSGESVLPAAQFFQITSGEILVLHDEVDLPYGQVAFKKGGGLAGHNGLKSLAKCLGNQEFLRIRMGIDRPTVGAVHSWVLGPFGKEEKKTLDHYLKSTADALETVLKEGFEKSAAMFSKKNFTIP